MSDRRHVILLGGIGGDCHSVGLSILRQSLTAEGYDVRFLGTQNTLDDFFLRASGCNVVMISSLDGHARYYLQGFRDRLARYRPGAVLWYLGGNLTVGDAFSFEKTFLELGFNRVFVKFTDARTVLATLRADLAGVDPARGPEGPGALRMAAHTNGHGPVSDDLMPMDEFRATRRAVLALWPTGRAAGDLRENAELLTRVPSYAAIQHAVHAQRRPPLIQPRCGVASVAEQIRLFDVYKSVGADTLSYQVDSLTRNNDYVKAAEAIRESRIGGVSTLNGFPVINHGVGALRRVMRHARVPLQTRHSTRKPELLAEISYAGGVSAFEGGAICYNIPYFKDYPLDESIRRWQYVDRLTGLYYERFGLVLDREYFGVLTGTLVPPCLAIATNILEALLAAQQGVKSVSVGYAEQGHRWQDVAAIRVMREKTIDALANLGHRDVRVNTVFHQYMAAFPTDTARSEELIVQSAATALLSGATRVMVKTAVESVRIPTVHDNSYAIQLVRRGFEIGRATLVNEACVEAEAEILRREVDALVAGVIACGHGVLSTGIVKAFERGLLDIPFSPSLRNRGEVVTGRDDTGAVRFLSTGSLPFDRDIVEWHRDRASRRRAAEGLRSPADTYLLVERDVMKLPRGEYDVWPLFA